MNITNDGDGLVVPILVPNSAETLGALTGIANAVDALGVKTGQVSQVTDRSTRANDENKSKLNELAAAYHHVTAAASSIANQLNQFVATVAELSAEQGRLSANSARLGLDFDRAADAAGRFTDETEAMGAATQLAEAGIRLTQGELESLTQVAARFAQNTGTTTASAIDALTNGLITGSARGLRPFGAELAAAAGDAHTVTDRLQALTEQARHTAVATDDAATSVERLKDKLEDAQRTMASGFSEGVSRMMDVASAANRASGATESWTDHLRELGQAAGTAAAFVVSSFNLAFESVRFTGREIASEVVMLAQMIAHPTQAGDLRAAHEAGRGARRADLDSAYAAHRAMTLDVFGDRRSAPAPESSGASAPVDMVFTEEEIAGDRRQRHRGARGSSDTRTREERLMDRAIAGAGEQERIRSRGVTLRRELEGVFTGTGEITPPGEDMDSSKGGLLGAERQAGSSAESRFSDFSKDRADQRRAELERRGFEQRYNAARTFTERWEDLHHRQVNATEEAAGAMDNALGGLGTALSKHFESIVKGQETVGEALKGILTDTLDSIAKESFTKGGFYAAEAIAKLIMYDFPGAATAAAASAAYFAAGATATGLGAAVAGGGSAPAAPAGGGSAPRSERTSGAANDNASTSGQTVVNHFYAPVIGGRTATDAEVGSRMDRYTDATTRRQTRARA